LITAVRRACLCHIGLERVCPMPIRTNDKGVRIARPPDREPYVAYPHLPVRALAMATASRLYAAGSQPHELPVLAAHELAIDPGDMCLVSLRSNALEALRPVAVAHARPSAQRHLRSVVASRERAEKDDTTTTTTTPPADAFSQTVVRTRGTLRMTIDSPRQLRLWFPPVYWPYLERAGVSSVMAAALVHRHLVLGALLLWRERDQPAFDTSDAEYVSQLATRVALGLRT
jgi:hypothetical protein